VYQQARAGLFLSDRPDQASEAAMANDERATDLEIIVENQNGGYQHWWCDGSGWHPGPAI
jgi:hypothetical protein